jgi:ATP-dependent exoDNAse (exonuclease V) beta subunit
MSAGDTALFREARNGVRRWLALADRVPPGELIDTVLRESAYVAELRGRRLAQAVQNIKKVRALVSRVESRGYATLGRLAAYFETLRAGDESNAVIDATGAVSLMTIHAAKGLEFPIVFVVNLRAAGRGRPPGFSVIEQGPTGEAEVAFGATEATALEERRDAEELKRLFYVAVTRARDRLYIAAEVNPAGRLATGPRSLASLLPGDLAEAWVRASVAPAGGDVEWVTEQGTFAFKVCHPLAEPVETATIVVPKQRPTSFSVVAPLVPAGRSIVAATTLNLTPEPAEPMDDHPGPGPGDPARRRIDDRLVGTVVHRLFQRRVDPALSEMALVAVAGRLLPPNHGLAAGDQASVTGQAASLYRTFRSRPDVVSLLGAGECHYEVPFFYDPPDRPGERVRGLIDCLVIAPDGSATVVEFKTGQPRAEHQAQAEWYVRAVQAAFGAGPVLARILYP